MQGCLSIILHAHLPFVRHTEHEKFLEESWLFEAITETYLPLLQIFEGWHRDGMDTPITLSLSPTLCSMLADPLLQQRYERYLNDLIALAEKEIHRTHWDRAYRELAWMYHHRFTTIRDAWDFYRKDLLGAFRKFQDDGRMEIITTAATHALLPMLVNHPSSIRAQILTARDHYKSCFGREPRGIWLPECAYVEGVEAFLQEANIRWFILDTHGVLHARPRPRYGTFAPLFTPNGIAAFGRDYDSSRQVWSQREGYPGDPRYRDFYRDIGFDLDFDYVKPYLPASDTRGFTGIKYFRITGKENKEIYDRGAALQAAGEHAQHFLNERTAQVSRLAGLLDRPPLIVAPYDAELFGHWWYEGPEFLDYFARKLFYDQKTVGMITPGDYLHRYPTNQIGTPSASTWGEEGYLRVWLNDKNEWIYPHLQIAQERMNTLAKKFPKATGLKARALKQAARELLLAQSSDWPFIMRTGTSPDYARRRFKEHLLRFISLHDQLTATGVDEKWLGEIESRDNLFPDADWNYWK
ncbi:MAG TPA: 1,4-alpha-glucan branching protein domain-containing protein [Verrucomicrobiae bacterium]|jgi:1,4-alpha-glucan branching enzyme